jgi:diguanylate cyclase (GGDEF)-like protein/PAS domain S-box-containing protein
VNLLARGPPNPSADAAVATTSDYKGCATSVSKCCSQLTEPDTGRKNSPSACSLLLNTAPTHVLLASQIVPFRNYGATPSKSTVNWDKAPMGGTCALCAFSPQKSVEIRRMRHSIKGLPENIGIAALPEKTETRQMLPENTMLVGSYDYRLVVLSVAIATLASYTALDLAGRVTVARGSARVGWLAGGASTMGLGIWSMHYIGMLAFRLSIPVWYDWQIVLLSLLAAIFASAAALHFATGEEMSQWRTALGSLVMGGGISAMHYVGMVAMRMRAMCHFNPSIVALSVILAVGTSFVALRLVFLARTHSERWKFTNAIVMGAAIPIMHYTGMASASFTGSDVAPDLSHAVGVSTLGVAGIATVTISALGIAKLTSAYNRLASEPRTKRTSALSACLRAARTAMAAFCIMFVYEAANEALHPTITVWTSHAVTILFATLVVALLTFTILKKQEQLNCDLSSSEKRYRLLFERSLAGIYRTTLGGRILDCNVAFYRMFGYASREELLTRPAGDLYLNSTDRDKFTATLQSETGLTNFECGMRRKDGSVIWILENTTLLPSEDGSEPELEGTMIDISERKRFEDVLQNSENKYRVLFEDSADANWLMDEKGFVACNSAALQMFGYPPGALMSHPADISPPNQPDGTPSRVAVEQKMASAFLNGKQRFEWLHQRKNGSVFPAEVCLTALTLSGQPKLLATVRDITDRKAAEERIQYLAYFDSLTGLPNRMLLRDRLTKAIADARRQRCKIALLFIDLDRFKDINDSLGHSVGDLFLQNVAERISRWAREQDTVARLGGDEFLIMLTHLKDATDAAVAAERLMDAMIAEFVVEGHPLNVSCSIGISVFPEQGADCETLIKNADAAMYSAKADGRNNFRFFNEEMNAQAVERLTLESSLRSALAKNQLFLMYQPQIDIATGRITGLEALLRWQHPELGLVPPDSFIRIAENSGLIVPIGEWVLRTACSQARKWQDEGIPAISVAVNVSAVQFRQAGFCELIRKVVQDTGLAPQYLELELTEGLLLANADVTVSVLQELKAMGVTLAIDDFGTGYSSFSYLRQFHVNNLKIDRSFINDVATNPDDAAITAGIIGMAKNLKLRVIAEGVENEAQMSFLRAHHCDEIQGYYFSEPLPTDKVADKLRGTVSAANALAHASGKRA